ncbi:MAG: histone deacetylase family protein [Rhizobiales bacterium]|nr:histone deacetylase family protein [Hyphomicrobiales bacterium]
MFVVFSDEQYEHEPIMQMFAGRMVEAPESSNRARKLLQGARDCGLVHMASLDFGLAPIEEIHDSEYLEFLRSAAENWRHLRNAGPEVVPHVHPVRYLRNRPTGVMGLAGYYMNSTNCPIGPLTAKAAYASAQTALTAAHALADGQKFIYALCRPPGHHAHADLASGFCFLNNCAVAANVLLKKFSKVAIIDIDVHHGNGTQEIFYLRNDVFCGSVHADPTDFYPFYQGYLNEVGEGVGHGWNLNLPLQRGSGSHEVALATAKLIDRAKELGCSALVIAVGLDTFAGDPMGVFQVSTAGFAEIASIIASAGLPTLLVQEGGYDGPHLQENIASFLAPFVQAESKNDAAGRHQTPRSVAG